MKNIPLPILTTAVLCFPGLASAQIVINEFQYDDAGTDDREFVELFNPGTDPIDISGWILGGLDPAGANTATTIPASTVIAAGGYYVIGQTGVKNVNQVVTSIFENDNETLELRNGATLVDALAYETNKGVAFASGVSAQVGPGIFGNLATTDLAGTPLNTTVSLGRFVDGRDTNNNGRDFGLRPSTPGSTNAVGGLMISYQPANPSAAATGSGLASTVGSFVNAAVIEPGIVSSANPNAIAAPMGGITKAYTAWDPSGGGNGVTSTAVFGSMQSSFVLQAYFDTRALSVQSNAAAVEFKGSEITMYGIGSGDAFTNLTDLTGAIGLTAGTLPVTDTANGFTGYAWIYEKAGIGPGVGGSAASNLLHLVNANDGGDAGLGGNTPLDWSILASYDLGTSSDGAWYQLGIDIALDGTGIATFNGQTTSFTATGLNSGAFNVGYRENLQAGADGTPDSLMRPATFTIVPEAGTLGLLTLGIAPLLRRRRTQR